MSNRSKLPCVALAIVLMGLAGCGVRGSLQAPPQAQAGGTATSAEGGEAKEDSAAQPKPHRGFVLDDILR